MGKFVNVFMLSVFLLVGCVDKTGIELVSPKEASSLIADKKAVIVDVREEDEWDEGHIAGAIHIPLNQLNDHLAELQKYKDSTVITQCKVGKRSIKALKLLKSAGFTNVYSMDGGIQAWSKEGLATQQK